MKRILTLCLMLLVGVLPAFPANGPASERQIKLRWSELGTFLETGKLLGRGKAMLMLPNSSIVQGQILEVGKDELVLKVSKSSDQKAYPKGRLSIPRSSVSTIRFTQTKGYGRALGTLAGVFGGLGLASLYALAHDEGAANAAEAVGVLAIPVGAGIGGYYAGRLLDRKTTSITVLPD